MKQKKYEKAVSHFQKALPFTQISSEIHLKMAHCYQQMGKQNLAELHKKRAKEAAGEDKQN